MTTKHLPRFGYGQQVCLCDDWSGAFQRYPTRARGGAVGVVTNVGPQTGGRRYYSVLFPDPRRGKHALPVRVREDHLTAWTGRPDEPAKSEAQP